MPFTRRPWWLLVCVYLNYIYSDSLLKWSRSTGDAISWLTTRASPSRTLTLLHSRELKNRCTLNLLSRFPLHGFRAVRSPYSVPAVRTLPLSTSLNTMYFASNYVHLPSWRFFLRLFSIHRQMSLALQNSGYVLLCVSKTLVSVPLTAWSICG